MNLLSTITSKAWFIDRASVQGYLPALTRLMQGKSVDFGQHHHKVLLMEDHQEQAPNHPLEYNPQQDIPTGVVAVIPIKGVMTKEDQECGPRGQVTIGQHVQNLANNPQVTGIVFDVDTPGGEATYMDALANIIRDAAQIKPVLAYVNGSAASAGYYLVSAAQEIYLSGNADAVGSIGVMCTILDMRAALEAEGINLIEIYADGSEDKNADYRAALDGDFEPIKKGMLNPYREQFVSFVKTARPGIDASVLSGKMYPATEAMALGMVDGIKTFKQVVARARELAASAQQNNSTQQQTMKNLNKVVGREVNSGAVFSAEELAKIDAALQTGAAAEDAAPKADAMAEVLAKLEKMEADAAATKAENAALAARVEALANMPGAEGSKVKALHEGAVVLTTEQQAILDKMESEAVPFKGRR